MRRAGYFYYSIKQNWASSSQQFPLCVIKVCSSQRVLSLQTLFPDPRMRQGYRSKYCWQPTWLISILCSGFVLSFHNHLFDYDCAVYQVVLCWHDFFSPVSSCLYPQEPRGLSFCIFKALLIAHLPSKQLLIHHLNSLISNCILLLVPVNFAATQSHWVLRSASSLKHTSVLALGILYWVNWDAKRKLG